jgi:hypothetical protein
MATVRRRVVSDPEVGDPVRYDRATERHWALDGSDIITLLVGLFYAVVGVLALIDLGFADFPSEATTDVMGLTHTQLWGIISIVLARVLLAGVGGYGRSTTTFAGALLLVVGIVVVAANDKLDATLATNEAYGWASIVLGAIVLIAAIAIPSVATRSDRVIDTTA